MAFATSSRFAEGDMLVVRRLQRESVFALTFRSEGASA